MYADDVKLYTRVKASSENDVPTLKTDIDKLAKWAQLWQLPISYVKCSVMVLNNFSGLIIMIYRVSIFYAG